MLTVPASAHFPVGYNRTIFLLQRYSVPASAHFPVGYNPALRMSMKRSVPASAHFPVGYNSKWIPSLAYRGSS